MSQKRLSRKHSVWLGDSQTSITLDDIFWSALEDIAATQGVSVRKIVERVSVSCWNRGNLSSALRAFILNEYREGRMSQAIANKKA